MNNTSFRFTICFNEHLAHGCFSGFVLCFETKKKKSKKNRKKETVQQSRHYFSLIENMKTVLLSLINCLEKYLFINIYYMQE